MEIFNSNLTNVFVKSRRECDDILELVDSLKEGSHRVIVQLLELLAIDLDHLHVWSHLLVRWATSSRRRLLSNCIGALFEATSGVPLGCCGNSLLEAGDSSCDCLSGAETKLSRICRIKDPHTVFQMLDVLLAWITCRSQCIQLIHDYGDHELAKLEYIWPLLWVCSHARSYSLDQQWAEVILVDWLVFTIYDLFGHSERVTCAKRLSKGH